MSYCNFQAASNPLSKQKANLKSNIKNRIFLSFVPHTMRNIKWYNYDTGKIGTVNHVRFDEGMNNLPFDLIPPSQRDLELVEQGKLFLSEVDEVDTGIVFQFYVDSFTKMEVRTLTVKTNCTSPTFELSPKLARDPQYG